MKHRTATFSMLLRVIERYLSKSCDSKNILFYSYIENFFSSFSTNLNKDRGKNLIGIRELKISTLKLLAPWRLWDVVLEEDAAHSVDCIPHQLVLSFVSWISGLSFPLPACEGSWSSLATQPEKTVITSKNLWW